MLQLTRSDKAAVHCVLAPTLQVGIMMENLRELWQRSSLPPLFVSSVLALFIQAAGGQKMPAKRSYSMPALYAVQGTSVCVSVHLYQ